MPITPEQLCKIIGSESQLDLERRLKNCNKKPEYAEHIPIIKQVLDSKFPEWNKPKRGRGGSSRTIACFQGGEREFNTAKEAYIWLVECFGKTTPTLFTDDIGRKTREVFAGQITAENSVKRMFFAKSKEKLFIETPELADDQKNSHKLTNGWYANMDINTCENFERLCGLAKLCNLKHPDDWEFMPLNPTKQFLDARSKNEENKKLDEML